MKRLARRDTGNEFAETSATTTAAELRNVRWSDGGFAGGVMRMVRNSLAAMLVAAWLTSGLAQQAPPAPAGGAREPSAGTAPQNPGARGRGPARGGFVTPVYDSVPPQIPATIKGPHTVLIFSKTNGYREEAAIQASNDALESIVKKRGWPGFVTENAAIMNANDLRRFKVVIWNNTSGDVLTEPQREAFKTWLENGGAFVGTHGAGGDPSYAWSWYPETLIGAQFTSHSSQQLGTIHIEDTRSPITKGLPAVWNRTVRDEWYAFKDNPRTRPGFHILATADETTYSAGRSTMGADHPMVWTHCVGKGPVFYSAIGHGAETYSEPHHLQLLENAIAWAMGLSGSTGCPAK
jgi:type 1 glutamine amidotransferase